MKIGIDKISFATPPYYIPLSELAQARNIDPLKYTKGLMQKEMSICDKDENIVTLGVKASKEILNNEDIENIDYVIVATETGLDNSKASAIMIADKLGISNARCIEIKQACYSATASIQLAKSHIYENHNSKVLIIASDIAKYGANNGGEPTQGVGAIAMIISKDPRIAIIENESTYLTKNIWDFYRPINSKYPIVDGKLSIDTYLSMYDEISNEYFNKYRKLDELSGICYHIPYSKLGLKALEMTVKNTDKEAEFIEKYHNSIKYNIRVGNIYTGSLYLNFLGMITFNELQENDIIGMYSYGSGSTTEFFTLKLVKNYKFHIQDYTEILDKREKLEVVDYERIFFE